MPRQPRWSRFHLEPAALLNDPAYIAMLEAPDGSRRPNGERAQRAYFTLLLLSWNEKEPGVIPYLPRRMATMVGLTLDEWREVEPLVAPAVKIRKADGAWLLPMMQREGAVQERRHRAKVLAALRGVEARRASRLSARCKPRRRRGRPSGGTPGRRSDTRRSGCN